MVNVSILNLILYNFLENHIKWLIILHCWNSKTQLEFMDKAMKQDLFLQMWPLHEVNLKANLKQNVFRHENPLLGIYFDINCNRSWNILQQASEEKLFSSHFHWLISDATSSLESFKRLFTNFQMAVDADHTLALTNKHCSNTLQNSSYILYDIYNNGFKLGGKLNVTIDRELLCSKSECILKQYLSSLYQRSKYQQRWLLQDITMRISTVVTTVPLTAPEDVILAHLNSIQDKHIDGVARFGFQYLMILKDNLGCSFLYNFTNLWSGTEVNGGVVGALGIENTADLASSPYLATANRIKYTQPLTKLGNFRQVCVFRTPQNNVGIKSKVFLEPFSLRVWLFFGVLLLLSAFLLWLTFFVEYHTMKTYLDFVPSFLTMCLISFGSACYQGSFLIPSSVGGRIVFITLSLLTFIIYNYYTSIVVAILLGSPVKSNIKTMGQLADSNLEVGLVPISYTKAFFNFSVLPEIKRFKRNKIESKRPDKVWLNVNAGLRRVRSEPGFVFVIESFSGYGLIERTFTDQEICDLNEILLRPDQPLYHHVNKNSSYREIIKLKQIRILESGLYQRHHRIWVKKRLNCYLSSSFLVQVGLEYTAPLFIMLATVYVLVVILMILELIWYKIERKLIMAKIYIQEGN